MEATLPVVGKATLPIVSFPGLPRFLLCVDNNSLWKSGEKWGRPYIVVITW